MKNDEVFELICNQVQAGGEAALTVTGRSMEPLFKDKRTVVTLTAPKGRIKRHDIVLYRRKNGQVVLHRCIKARGNTLCCRGDNELVTEKNVDTASIVAVGTRAVTDGSTRKLYGATHRLFGTFCGLRRTVLRVGRIFKG